MPPYHELYNPVNLVYYITQCAYHYYYIMNTLWGGTLRHYIIIYTILMGIDTATNFNLESRRHRTLIAVNHITRYTSINLANL